MTRPSRQACRAPGAAPDSTQNPVQGVTNDPTRESRHYRRRRPDRIPAGISHRLRPAARPRHPRHPAAAGNPACARRAEGRGDGAAGLRFPDARRGGRDRPRRGRVRRCRLRAAGGRQAARPGHGAQGPAHGKREDLLRAGQGAERQRASQGEGAGGRQPGQYQRPHRAVERAGPRPCALHRHDPAGPQPRPQPAGRQDRRERQRHPPDDHLGQSLGDPVPGHQSLHGRRQARGQPGGRRVGAR